MTTKRWMKVHVALESCSTCFNQRFSIGPKQLPAGTIWPRRALHQLPDCPILQSPASRPSAPPLAHTEIVLKTCSLFNWAIQWAAWGGWSLNLSGQLGEFSSDSWFYCLPVGSGGDAQWVKCTSWLIDWVSTQRADRYWDRSNAVLVKKLQLIIFIWWPYLLLTCVMYRIWGELRSWSFDDWWCRFRDVCFAPKKKVVDRIWIIVYFVATPKIIYDDITSDGCPLSDEAHQNLKSDQKRKYATFKSLYILSLAQLVSVLSI